MVYVGSEFGKILIKLIIKTIRLFFNIFKIFKLRVVLFLFIMKGKIVEIRNIINNGNFLTPVLIFV